MTIDMSQFYQVFFDEADELLAEMEKLLLALDVSAPDGEDLNAIFRAAHSIKGGAATFAFTDITEVTHMLESLLDRIRKGEMALTPEHVDAFLAAKDVLTMQMDGHHHGSSVDQDAVGSVCQRLKALSQGIVPQTPAVEAAPVAAAEPAAPVADADGNYIFRIELPAVPQRDVDALAAELGLLGTIGQECLADQRVVFTLTTSESQDNIVAICSFVLDPDDTQDYAGRCPGGRATPSCKATAKRNSRRGAGLWDFRTAEGGGSQPVLLSPSREQAATVNAPQPSQNFAAARATYKEGGSQESSSIRVGIEKCRPADQPGR